MYFASVTDVMKAFVKEMTPQQPAKSNANKLSKRRQHTYAGLAYPATSLWPK